MKALKGVGKGQAPQVVDGMTSAMVKKLNVDWYYNWSLKPDLDVDTPFIPMVWGSEYCKYMPKYVNNNIQTEALLGFNEPDHPKQSNMSVEQALILWPKLVDTGKRLGSPVMAGDATKDGCWLDTFMKGVKDKKLRVDFICLHIYKPVTKGKMQESVDNVLLYLRNVYNKYKLPIWITEFCPVDINNNLTSTDAPIYLKMLLDGFLKLKYLERYAIHTRESLDPKQGFSSLFHTNGMLKTAGLLYSKY